MTRKISKTGNIQKRRATILNLNEHKLKKKRKWIKIKSFRCASYKTLKIWKKKTVNQNKIFPLCKLWNFTNLKKKNSESK